MARRDDLYRLPGGLPVPAGDGACDHLQGLKLPSVLLSATSGDSVDLVEIPGITVVYIYPRTGIPDREPPRGWNEIPGARGCTPQSCAFRDHSVELNELGARIYGLSTQDSIYQQEAVGRLHLPYALLSDKDCRLIDALKLPTFVFNGERLAKRVTLILRDGKIEHVFYPVFPPDRNADQVVDWIRRIL